MPAPSWVPVVDGVTASTWLDFRSQQYWNNNAIVTDLTTLLNDVNGTSFHFTAGLGIDNLGFPDGVLPSAQTSINGSAPIPLPTPSALLDTLNMLDSAGGYTMIVGFIYQGGNGNGGTVEMGSPWQNPGTSNFNLLELGTNDSATPNYQMTLGIEQLTPSYFYSYATTTSGSPPPPFGPAITAQQQVTINEGAKEITFSMNGLPSVGPITMGEAMNAEGAMQFLYLGGFANSVDGIAQHNSFPIGVLQYFALFSPLTLPVVFPPVSSAIGRGHVYSRVLNTAPPPPPVILNYRITETGATRITLNGSTRTTLP